MMKVLAKLKRIHSPDVSDLDSYVPDDPENFSVFLQVMFGPKDSEGEESFDMTVCNYGWIKNKANNEKVFDAKNHLIVNKFDMNRIREFLEEYAESCSGSNWRDVALKLARLGHWEFEDYKA